MNKIMMLFVLLSFSILTIMFIIEMMITIVESFGYTIGWILLGILVEFSFLLILIRREEKYDEEKK